MRATTTSHFGMGIAAFLLIFCNLYCIIVLKTIPTLDNEKAFLYFSCGIVLCFSPVYLNLLLEKIFLPKVQDEIKQGVKNDKNI
jgi:O-antigen ligase